MGKKKYSKIKGSGLALWNKNYDELSKKYKIYSLDLLGFGLSSRPDFHGKTPEEAEEFWIGKIKKNQIN